jgi:hypothetical protein
MPPRYSFVVLENINACQMVRNKLPCYFFSLFVEKEVSHTIGNGYNYKIKVCIGLFGKITDYLSAS